MRPGLQPPAHPPPDAPTLARGLRSFSVLLFGVTYICPTVVISTFGLLMQTTHGAPHWAYLIATLAMLCTAFSYGKMAARYTEAGSAFTYVSHTMNPLAGFLTGWVLALDYLFVPMVICLFTAKAVEEIVPGVSFRVWVALIAVATTVINLIGIKLADRINLVITAAQMLVIGALIWLCLRHLHGSEVAAHSELGSGAIVPHIAALMSGAAIAAYSFLGFDSVTTLSEEAHEPATSVPLAVVLVALVSGVIYVVCAYLLSRVHPGAVFADVDNAGYQIVKEIAGAGFDWILAVILIAYVASVMCAQAGSARLLYAMGRTGGLPRIFSRISARFRTPSFNVALTGTIMLVGEVLDVDSAAACVNFGAFIAFLAVDLSVVWDHLTQRRLSGGGGKLLIAGMGAVAMSWLIASLHRTALVLGLVWLLIGVLYLFGRRGYLRESPAAPGDSTKSVTQST